MKSNAKQKKKRALNTRTGVVLIAMLALVVLIVNLVSASYSWFTPQTVEKKGLDYGFTGKVRSEDCEMYTYRGTKITSSNRLDGEYIGQIRYDTSPNSSSVNVSGGGNVEYFKTEIINQDTNSASDISLYISSLGACTLAVTYPGNTVRTFSETQTDLYIVRDAYVKRKDNADVNGPGKLTIEWFVKSGSGSVTVNPANLYLLYN
jgi:hypothetical protein